VVKKKIDHCYLNERSLRADGDRPFLEIHGAGGVRGEEPGAPFSCELLVSSVEPREGELS